MTIEHKGDIKTLLNYKLTILTPYLKTTNKENMVIIYLLDKYLQIKHEVEFQKKLNSPETFANMARDLGISIDYLNNIKRALRVKKLLTENNSLSNILYTLIPSKDESKNTISFKFSLQ